MYDPCFILVPLRVNPKQDAGILVQYVKHLVFSMASKGWNVVVSNHRGLGGISITVSFLINKSYDNLNTWFSVQPRIFFISFLNLEYMF